ncbi:MAG: thioredoxin [Ignavibacteria bacterium]|jgi:thioredoxin 1|nr:thioredoxin [Ignavibacteria bacterium]
MAEPLEITDATFDAEIKQSQLPVLIDFGAVWCGPCRALAPTVDALCGEYAGKLKVCKVDVDVAQGISGEYGIRSVPTLIFIKNGVEVDRMVGAVPKKEIVKVIDKLLA